MNTVMTIRVESGTRSRPAPFQGDFEIRTDRVSTPLPMMLIEISRFRLREVLITACLLLTVLIQSAAFADDLDEEIRSLESLSKTYHLIQSEYVEPVTIKQLLRSAIEGMVSSLDEYSEAIDREELEKLEAQATGKFAGVGVSIQKDVEHYVVTQVIKGSPADNAGLKPGDVLVQLNDVRLSDQKDTDLSRLVRGKAGTPLTVSFYHPEKPDQMIRRDIIRKIVAFPSVLYFDVGSTAIVIQVQQFQKSTPGEIDHALGKKRYKSVILDLRNNPGGLFLAAVETADLFIDGGEIVETRDKDNALIERYVAQSNKGRKPPFLIVLINRYSASSAEIVAGAIKDRGVGLIVGEISYGKGVVQTVFPLGSDLFVKLTTARYFTPSGISFHKSGIKPDYEIEDTIEVTRYGPDDKIYLKSQELIGKPGGGPQRSIH